MASDGRAHETVPRFARGEMLEWIVDLTGNRNRQVMRERELQVLIPVQRVKLDLAALVVREARSLGARLGEDVVIVVGEVFLGAPPEGVHGLGGEAGL